LSDRTKQPNPVDKQIGQRVRTQRLMIGMSQEKLGDALGVTFQQIQKYEKGTNRIGSGRLHQIAHVLGVPVNFFFQDLGDETNEKADPGLAGLVNDKAGLELLRAFNRIKTPATRQAILQLVRSVADPADAEAKA
jgi:transcriptional regulator with XRE-family HTH domain